MLRGAFNIDIFQGKILPQKQNKPLIKRKDSSHSTIYPEVDLSEHKDPLSNDKKVEPSSYNYNEHNTKIQDIIQMIQK